MFSSELAEICLKIMFCFKECEELKSKKVLTRKDFQNFEIGSFFMTNRRF